MNQESKQSLSKVGELVAQEKLNPKQKYLRIKEAVEVYRMSRTKLTEEALKCGALYKVGTVKLINIETFEKYLESCRIPGDMYI